MSNQKIFVSPVILDKLAFSLPAPVLGSEEIERRFIDLMNRLVKEGAAQKSFAGKLGYKHKYEVPVNGQEFILFGCAPYRPNVKAFVRIEFNPAKVGKIGIAKLKKILQKVLAEEYVGLMMKARLNSLHTPVDIMGVVPDQLLIQAKHTRKTAVVTLTTFDGKGMIETLYFGSVSSSSRVTTYDKNVQLTSQDIAEIARSEMPLKGKQLAIRRLYRKGKRKPV